MKAQSIWVLAGGWCIGIGLAQAAEPADSPRADPLHVVDADGKEHALKAWKITLGTRPLSWLAEVPKGDKPDPRTAGPQALVLREEDSTSFVDGIVTLVPLERVRSIVYDSERQLVTVTYAAGEKGEGELKGSTKYKGVNKLTIEAETDLGELGVALAKFQGGIAKGGIRSVRFPRAQAPAAAAAGRPARLTTTERDRGVHPVADLVPLYRLADGTSKPIPLLFFKKTLRIDPARIRSIRAVDSGTTETEWQVTLKDGATHTLTLLQTVTLDDNRQAVLEGLLGRVPAGYKLFPVHLIGEMKFDEP